MKAIMVREWGAPDVLKMEEMPDPEAAGGDVVVRLKAIGINPVDTYIRSGAYPYLPELPCVPGGDAAGIIEAIGPDVAGLEVGQHVYVAIPVGGRITGCYAERVRRPAHEVFRLPDNVSFEAGAAFGLPYATAYYALFNRGRARPGETVFIHGASGAVGIAATQIARSHGITVIGSAGSDRGLALVMEQGAHHVADHREENYLEAVRAVLGGDGPELVLEMLANVNLQADLELVRTYGRIVVIGNRGTIEINPRSAMMKEADILGLALWNCPPDELTAIHTALIAGLENGSLRPVIGREMPLSEAAAAHAAVLEPGAFGKIVLIP